MTASNVKILYTVLIVFFVTSLVIVVVDPSTLDPVCRENGVVESTTALAYLVSSVLFFVLYKRSRFRNVWMLFLGVMFFGLFGEEISWGQALLHFGTPEGLRTINKQEETNIHNIKGIHEHIRAVGLFVVITICFLIPGLAGISRGFREYCQKHQWPVFPLYAVGIPVAAFVYMILPRATAIGSQFNLDELGEMTLSIGFLLFALSALSAGRRQEQVNRTR